MKTRIREIAKVGIFGSIDNPTIVTEKDLREIAETFPDQKTAPIQFGHWSDASAPRLGNVVAVIYDEANKNLTASIEEKEELYQAVEDGYYPDISIGAKQRASDGKMYLHHLAYLGEEAPAIKDLKESIDEKLSTPPEEIAASDTAAKEFPSPNSKQLYLSDTNQKEAPSMTEEEIKAMQDENARLKADTAAKEKLLSDQFNAARTAEKEQLKKAISGKLPEVEAEKVLTLCDSFEMGRTIELSDGDKKHNVSPVALLADVFGKIKLPVEPGEMNLSDPDTPPSTEALSFNVI